MSDDTKDDNVVSLFKIPTKVEDDDSIDYNEYELTEADTLAFLKVLGYIQSKSVTMESQITVNMDSVSIKSLNTLTTLESNDEDNSFSVTQNTDLEANLELFLPLIHMILPPEDHAAGVDLMTLSTMLAIEGLDLEMFDDTVMANFEASLVEGIDDDEDWDEE